MKKFTTLKTLLVGLCAMGATSAWGQTTRTYDFEDGNAVFTMDSRITAAVVSGNQTIYDNVFELDGKAVRFTGAGNAQNGYCFAHLDFDTLCTQAAKVKVEFETVLGNGARSIISIGDAAVRSNTGNSSKNTYSPKGAIFRIGTDKNNSYVNATTVGASTVVSQKWLKVTVEVDEVEKKYTYSVVDKATSEVLYSNGENPIAFYDSDATHCTQIDMFGYINNSQMGLIDNLSITVTKDEREQANYTVKFVDENDNEIKEAVTRQGAVGDGIVLLPADKEVYRIEGGMKYFYVSDNSEGAEIASNGSTVVTVVYREAKVWNYTVNFVAEGDINLGSKTGTGFEGDQMSVPYSKYLVNDGQLYKKDRGLSTTSEFNYKFNLDADNKTTSITYAAESTITNVIFCSEAENIEGLTPITSGNSTIRSSNSASAYAPADTKITSVSPGKYKIHAIIYDASKKEPNSHWFFSVGNSQVADFNCTTVNIQEFDSEEFTVTCESDVIMAKAGGDLLGLDAIYIVKTGDVELPASVTVPVTSAGYATYCSEYALVLSDVEAYTATIEDNRVNFVSQNGIVAPGTGLLIKKENGGEVTIPVATEGAETIADNALIGVVASKTIDAGSFVLMGSPAVGFYKTTNGFTVGANTAYIAPLPASSVESAREFIAINGEATAIKAVETKQQNGEIYNLAGQRVNKAQKGLYIQNGKKVIIK